MVFMQVFTMLQSSHTVLLKVRILSLALISMVDLLCTPMFSSFSYILAPQPVGLVYSISAAGDFPPSLLPNTPFCPFPHGVAVTWKSLHSAVWIRKLLWMHLGSRKVKFSFRTAVQWSLLCECLNSLACLKGKERGQSGRGTVTAFGGTADSLSDASLSWQWHSFGNRRQCPGLVESCCYQEILCGRSCDSGPQLIQWCVALFGWMVLCTIRAVQCWCEGQAALEECVQNQLSGYMTSGTRKKSFLCPLA